MDEVKKMESTTGSQNSLKSLPALKAWGVDGVLSSFIQLFTIQSAPYLQLWALWVPVEESWKGSRSEEEPQEDHTNEDCASLSLRVSPISQLYIWMFDGNWASRSLPAFWFALFGLHQCTPGKPWRFLLGLRLCRDWSNRLSRTALLDWVQENAPEITRSDTWFGCKISCLERIFSKFEYRPKVNSNLLLIVKAIEA
jgi:hypothetical protein